MELVVVLGIALLLSIGLIAWLATRSGDGQLRAQLAQQEAINKEQYGKISVLETQLQERAAHYESEKLKLAEQQLILKQEFTLLANDILEAKGKVLGDQQKEVMVRQNEGLDKLLAPLRDQIRDFRDKVETSQKENTAGRAALKEQLEMLRVLNKGITDEAHNLTRALKGDKKLQGNWGELQVETILEKSGLVKGQQFHREKNYKDDGGQNKRPDFVVDFPGEKHIVIDSKVSLVDYVSYVSSDDDNVRQSSLDAHAKALRNHIVGLSEKDYTSIHGINSPDFVLMFVPVEPAFLAAFQHDPDLYNYAFERNIVVVTPSTLLATLRTVANLWAIENQNKSAVALADRAGKLHDKLVVFLEKMIQIDTSLDQTRRRYDEAMTTLKDGTGNVLSQMQTFQKLGVRVKKEIPLELTSGLEADD